MPNSAEYMRQYYIDHKEDWQKRYQRNKKDPKFCERRKVYNKQRYDENPEQKKRYEKEYRVKNKERILAKEKIYYQKNKERILAYRFLNKYADVMSEYILSLDEY